MPVTKKCEQCGAEYARPPAIAKRSRFCSKACHNANQTTRERRELKCEHCNELFVSAQDHGKWPRFCSRECFESGSVKAEWKTCPACSGKFLAERTSHNSEDGLRIYCSRKCAHDGLKRGITKQCVYCGGHFYISTAKQTKRPDESCCSLTCRLAFYRESRAHAWKGGSYINTNTGDRIVRCELPGYVSKYVGEHRLIAARTIGRPLVRGEVVIRINRNPSDNRPENLFLCESNSEFSMRRNGSLPWPTFSNLHDLAKVAVREEK